MSECLIIARHRLLCDLCGCIIWEGEKYRMIRDDFQKGIVRFEHLRCPGSQAVTTSLNWPNPPKNICCNHIICLA